MHSCYIKARENKSVGYMKRLKPHWNELHPGFEFLSDKNLRDVASRIALSKVVIDTGFDNTKSNATETDIVNNEVVEEVNCPVNTVNDQATNETTAQHVTPLSTTQEELLEVLRPIFERNYEIVKNSPDATLTDLDMEYIWNVFLFLRSTPIVEPKTVFCHYLSGGQFFLHGAPPQGAFLTWSESVKFKVFAI